MEREDKQAKQQLSCHMGSHKMKGTDSGIYHVARQLSDMANIVAAGYHLPSSRQASMTNTVSYLFKSDIVGFSRKSSGHFSRLFRYYDLFSFSKRNARNAHWVLRSVFFALTGRL